MAAVPDYIEPFTHLRLSGGRLFLSICGECGLVVAASPREHLLYLAERLHRCPVYLNYTRSA